MDTNETIRQQVLRLIDLGVSQKVLARKMRLTETWFSRWVNQKRPDLVIPVSAMDGLTRYLDELAKAIRATEWATARATSDPENDSGEVIVPERHATQGHQRR